MGILEDYYSCCKLVNSYFYNYSAKTDTVLTFILPSLLVLSCTNNFLIKSLTKGERNMIILVVCIIVT